MNLSELVSSVYLLSPPISYLHAKKSVCHRAWDICISRILSGKLGHVTPIMSKFVLIVFTGKDLINANVPSTVANGLLGVVKTDFDAW